MPNVKPGHRIRDKIMAVDRVVENKVFRPVHICEATGFTSAAVSSALSSLVVDGSLVSLGSGDYQRSSLEGSARHELVLRRPLANVPGEVIWEQQREVLRRALRVG